MIDLKKIGPWSRVGKLLAAAPQRMQAAFDKALLQEAQFLRTKIVEGIREQAPGGQAFTPLAPTTLAIRQFRGFHGTKALLVNGDLRNSITVTKDGDQVFVGVLRTARNRAGKSLVDIAALHEHGSRPIVVRLTPKARAFLHAAFRPFLPPSSRSTPSPSRFRAASSSASPHSCAVTSGASEQWSNACRIRGRPVAYLPSTDAIAPGLIASSSRAPRLCRKESPCCVIPSR